ncbi:hypothetical protein [Pontibacter flavimaris]|uniref:Outer membrane protein beta-barrel domain-containing protein n=1 Tax=Pontibacter flavimaris TaxID=1797110 RepID=A0A1Q5PHI5_9BACT|nr:hypothetical protein [Pontibacter flavimaris]OKL41651.1 hypothetical protein A3841_11505 [Pontibacter flavimaris]
MPIRAVILVFLLAILSVWQEARAQKGQQDLNLSYGFASTPVMVHAVWDIFTGKTKLNVLGPAGIEYNYHLSERVILGFAGSYTRISSRNPSSGDLHYRSSYYAAMPQVLFYLGKKDKLEVYSGLSLGVAYHDHLPADERAAYGDVIPAFQLTGLGLRSNKRNSLFAELGFGYKGWLNVGLSHRLREVKK